MSDLVSSFASQTVPLVRNSLQTVQDIGTLFHQSGKYKRIFFNVKSQPSASLSLTEAVDICSSGIRRLCPTRWLTRVSAVKSVVDQYGTVLESLDRGSEELSGETAVKANGLHYQLSKTETLHALKIALEVLQPKEKLNKACQSQKGTLSGVLEMVTSVKQHMISQCTDDVFDSIFDEVTQLGVMHNMKSISLPRKKKVPLKVSYSETHNEYNAQTARDYFRPMYFELVDGIVQQLEDRFDKEDVNTYMKLENVLLTGKVDTDIIGNYKSINIDDLSIEMKMFQRKANGTNHSVGEAAVALQQMSTDVRKLFCETEKLVRLLLVSPMSSAVAERSFSSLRRLKTWLRSTVCQPRLNSVAVCHIHKELLDEVDTDALLREFISRSEIRENLFGHVNVLI